MSPHTTSSREPTQRLTDHAKARLRQRGYREEDLSTVVAHGTAGADAVILTRSDVERRVRLLKQEIQALERLSGTAVVTAGGVVQTVYRPGSRRMRRMLQRSGPRKTPAADTTR